MRITVNVPDRLEKSVRQAATRRKRSVSSLVTEAIEQYLARQNRRAAADRVLARISGQGVAADALDQLRKLRDQDRNDRA
jgi:predicted transcriptional regulator